MTKIEVLDNSMNINHPSSEALLAVHLVSQILDEAYIIANVALESGQPWRDLSILKSFKSDNVTDEEIFAASKGDCDFNENNTETAANAVATSTPQKVTPMNCSDENEMSVAMICSGINPFIGQGDEDIEMEPNDLANSAAVFINSTCIFEMSGIDHVVTTDDTIFMQVNSGPNETLQALDIKESHFAIDCTPTETFVGCDIVPHVDVLEDGMDTIQCTDVNSDYTYLANAFLADIKRDVTFYIENDKSLESTDFVNMYKAAVVEELMEDNLKEKLCDINNKKTSHNKNDVTLYEDTYASLNRDYDPESEEGEEFPFLRDPTTIKLQDVELLPSDTTDEELAQIEMQNATEKQEPLDSLQPESTVKSSHKSSQKLTRACRKQGAKILACLRGWWKRKSLNKHKESRDPGKIYGAYPLSPNTRRRTSSFLDDSLTPGVGHSNPQIWKFNTVTEALINTNCWKEYTFDPKSDACRKTSEV